MHRAGTLAAGVMIVIGSVVAAHTAPPEAPRHFRLKGTPIAWPSAATTGPSNPALLIPCGDITVTQPGTVIENVDVAGFINIQASSVTIRNFRITGSNFWGIKCNNGAYTNILIEDGEINGLNEIDDAIAGSYYTARRLHIHHTAGDSFKADTNCRIEACYIHDIGQAAGAHGDGVQMMGGTDITIVGNNFDLTTGTVNACIFPGGGGTVYNILVDGNRLNGGGWCVYGNEYMTVQNNRFGRACVYGPVAYSPPSWSNNRWEDTGALIEP
jgi:hypothetical protein